MPRANSPFLTSISGSLRGGPTFRATSQTPDIVMQTRPVPTDRRTAKQAAVRDAYSRLAYLWKNLSHLDKEPYEIMAERRNLTPWNCWLSFHLPLMRLTPKFYTVFAEGAGSTVQDFAINGQTGTINGAVFAEKNQFPCLSFDGVDDRITWPIQDQYQLTNIGTIYSIGYIKDNSGISRTILTNWQSPINYMGFDLYIGPTGIINLREGTGTAWNFVYTPPVVSSNKVNSISVTKNGSSVIFYLNGTAIPKTSPLSAITPGTGSLYSGANVGLQNEYKGELYIVALLPSELSAAQIAALDAHYLPFFT